jgi:hypothetical protein
MKRIFVNPAISFTILLIMAFSAGTAFAQSRKDIKESKVKTMTVYRSDFKTGKEVKNKESVSKFDENGNTLDEIKYENDGKFQEHFSYTYNSDNDKTSETEYDAAGKATKVTKFTYNTNGDKLSETEYDAAGKVTKISKYTYKGKLKDEKSTYDSKNKMLSKKKCNYEYYK